MCIWLIYLIIVIGTAGINKFGWNHNWLSVSIQFNCQKCLCGHPKEQPVRTSISVFFKGLERQKSFLLILFLVYRWGDLRHREITQAEPGFKPRQSNSRICTPRYGINDTTSYVYFILCLAKLWASLVAQLVKIRLQCGRLGFDLWVGKIPWIRERLPTLVFWPGEFHGVYSPWGRKELDATERLSLTHSLLNCVKLTPSDKLNTIWKSKSQDIWV